MKIEIRKTKEDGIIQITTLDERWYSKQVTLNDSEPVRTELRFNPSITWIGHYSPMGVGLLKHYAEHGWDEAETIKREAAEKGSKVHQACEALLAGQSVSLEMGFKNPETGDHEELTPDEYYGVMTFAAFWEEFTKQHTVALVDTEKVVWVDPQPGENYGYAGTRDVKLIVDGKPTIIDLKTSKEIYLTHELQLSALKHADPDLPDTFILQLGYKKNKAGWKLTATEDKVDLFLSAKRFWADANPEAKPKQKDYPPEITLTFPVPDPAPSVRVTHNEEPKKAETKSTTTPNGKGKRGNAKAGRRPKAPSRS